MTTPSNETNESRPERVEIERLLNFVVKAILHDSTSIAKLPLSSLGTGTGQKIIVRRRNPANCVNKFRRLG